MSLVSIIIPVFNSQQTIKKCISSIENQTFKDMDVIIVDDGSTDQTGLKIKEVINKSSRINYKYVYQENSGVSKARNTGIENAHSKYLTFIDADDYISPDHIQTLLDHMANEIDLVSVGYESIYDYNQIETNKNSIQDDNVLILNKKDSLIDLYYKRHLTMYVWDKLYKLDIINKYNIRFVEGVKIGEDGLFVNTYLNHSNKICYLFKSTYYYYQNENSVMHKNDKKFLDELYRANQIGFKFEKENFEDEISKAYTAMLIEGIEYFIRTANKMGLLKLAKYKGLILYFKGNYKVVMVNSDFSFKKKVKVLLSLLILKAHKL